MLRNVSCTGPVCFPQKVGMSRGATLAHWVTYSNAPVQQLVHDHLWMIFHMCLCVVLLLASVWDHAPSYQQSSCVPRETEMCRAWGEEGIREVLRGIPEIQRNKFLPTLWEFSFPCGMILTDSSALSKSVQNVKGCVMLSLSLCKGPPKLQLDSPLAFKCSTCVNVNCNNLYLFIYGWQE